MSERPVGLRSDLGHVLRGLLMGGVPGVSPASERIASASRIERPCDVSRISRSRSVSKLRDRTRMLFTPSRSIIFIASISAPAPSSVPSRSP